MDKIIDEITNEIIDKERKIIDRIIDKESLEKEQKRLAKIIEDLYARIYKLLNKEFGDTLAIKEILNIIQALYDVINNYIINLYFAIFEKKIKEKKIKEDDIIKSIMIFQEILVESAEIRLYLMIKNKIDRWLNEN
ncbi:MAG: hypothetical protein ACTSRP_07425 [Candidatus Helarchaeota archaeon]